MMRMTNMFALVAITLLFCQPVLSVDSTLTFDSEDAKNRPVAKVVAVLKDMIKTMEKEAEADEELYDKMACWCETNDKEKSKAIADAETRIADLSATIEELTALSAELNTEIKKLEKEVAKNQEGLEKATEMRMKQLAEFQGEEKDLLGSISAMKSAVTVLSKHQSASFIQVAAPQIASRLNHIMEKHVDVLSELLSDDEQHVITSFIQAPMDTMENMDTAPSGEIFGILNSMKETFETNLATTQKDESTNQKAYEDLKAAKEEQIADGQKLLDEKMQELATTDEKNAAASEDKEDTENILASDEEFLKNLKAKCAQTDAEFAERTKTRKMEMEACSKVQAMLTSDEAHDLFSKTLGFVQTKSTSHSKIRSEASRVLMNAAQKFKSPRLSELAYSAKKDAFAAVKKNIDVLIADLWATQKEEVKQKDFCTEEFNTNQAQTEKKDREKEDVDAEIEDYKSTLKELNTVISGLKAEIAEMKEQLKRAGEDREIENKEFQMTVADQRASQKLLGRALQVLKGFYEKKAAAFVEEGDNDEQPAGFKKYKKNEAGGGVMAMIAGIVNAAKAMEAEAIRAEQDSQAGYEAFVKDTNGVLEAKEKDLVNKSEEKGKVEAEKVEADGTMESIVTELEGLAAYKAELHGKCDFLLKNFELRQSSRVEEVEALKQAKAILSGAKFDSFVQTTMKLQQ
eukprot:gnl/TRDRNA2_/TRDRNA2_175977_c3_seq7.p1 gnl/TRDRNA2_/TRDRNA2_175977_c3~~gnl/TRDRNA2_/TRDRNA2_175977_c3_seq7.p1  ORF type:complete len:687 (+),score=278.84 gnl/TRDRNA2_/TRDRNA2_175977_c3_seq7:94-2154(+)